MKRTHLGHMRDMIEEEQTQGPDTNELSGRCNRAQGNAEAPIVTPVARIRCSGGVLLHYLS
jgi:hypothetical protein